jgi:hypothetical protein
MRNKMYCIGKVVLAIHRPLSLTQKADRAITISALPGISAYSRTAPTLGNRRCMTKPPKLD